MKRLFQVVDRRGKRVKMQEGWEFFDNKQKAKECRDFCNEAKHMKHKPYKVAVAPDHWRYDG